MTGRSWNRLTTLPLPVGNSRPQQGAAQQQTYPAVDGYANRWPDSLRREFLTDYMDFLSASLTINVSQNGECRRLSDEKDILPDITAM